MKCPRCNHEWDVRQSPCPRCNLYIRAPGLQGSTNRQIPRRPSPLDSFVSFPTTGDGITQARPDYLRGPISDQLAQSQSPMPSNRLQSSRFPLPSTGKLDPQRTLPPLSSNVDVLNVPPSPSLTGLRLSSPGVQNGPPSLAGLRLSTPDVQADTDTLLPGTLLHRDRYSLQKNLSKQEWPLGIVETIWSAFDTRITMSPVVIHEISLPEDASKETQEIPYTATKVLTSIGRNIHVLPLRDVFSHKGRSFFVFEPVDGASLLTLLFNSGRRLPEKEVITCCLQMVELLDVCAQQSPPLIHGNIRPDYIVRKSTDSLYVLTNFSVALAGGLARIVEGMDITAMPPHTTNSFLRGKTDGRTDLQGILATAYYSVTGHWLSDTSIMAAGVDISPQLRALLLKGLRAPLHQRYQTPTELYQDLLALHSAYQRVHSSPLFPISEQTTRPFTSMVQPVQSEPRDMVVPSQPTEKSPEQSLLVPLPEELPLLKNAHDMRNAVLWFAGMLLGLVVLLAHGLM